MPFRLRGWKPWVQDSKWRSLPCCGIGRRWSAKHGHDPKKCDVIVCWVHNWPECPLEVIELSKEIAKIAGKTLAAD
jgi:hypothetical protein